MDNPNPIRYSDLITPDNSIQNLIAQLDALISKYDEMRSKVQSQAAATAKSMETLSGATEEQQKELLKNAEASQALLTELQKLNSEEFNAKKAKAELNAASREEAQLAKLLTQLNNSKEGSYNKLSAQYRLNKMALNEMSEAERKSTEYGRKLEAETNAIYEEMNRLQKATGMAQLQVGHYERALGSVLGVNTQFVSVLTDTDKAMETFKGILNVIKTPIGAVIGLVGAAVAAFKLFKDSVHETQATGDQFDNAMAGWNNTWAIFKKSISTVDFSLFIRGAADAARAGRELQLVLDEVFERTNSARLLRASMSEENAILEEAMRNNELSYKERLDAADQYLKNMEPIYAQEEETARRVRDAQLNNLFSVTNARQYATEEERKRAQEEFAANIKNYNLNEDLINQAMKYNDAVKNRDIIWAQERKVSGAAAEAYRQQRLDMQATIDATSEAAKAFADFAKQYNLANDEQVKAYVEAQIAYDNALVATYNDQKRIVTLQHSLKAQQKKEDEADAKAAIKAQQDAAKEAERLAAEQAKAEEQAAAERERIRKEEITQQKSYLQAQLQSIELRLSVEEKYTEAYLQLQLEAVEKQREIALFENAQLTEEVRQQEADINAKYDAEAIRMRTDFYTKIAQRDLAASQELAQAEFDLLDTNERQKTIFRLLQEKARLEALLEIDKTATEKMTEMEIEAIKKTIKAIEKEVARTGYKNIYELLGISLDSDQQTALNTALNSIKDSLGSLMDSWKSVADAAKEAADAQVDAAQKALDAEIEARDAGYANEVANAQRELDLAKANQRKAEQEQKRAQKAQMAADSAMQASSLVTATANLWKAYSGLPLFGKIAALAAIATMWGSFGAAKIRALSATKNETYGEGTVELLEGGSHASGHDIDLGVKKDGTRRRAEGGEFFAVINKRSSRRYRNVIPDVIHSLNDGTFAERYQRANAAMSGMALNMMGGTDISRLEKDVSAIRRQGDESHYIDNVGNMVLKYKNLTRRIKR